MSSYIPPAGELKKRVTTGAAGFTLQNATPTILTYNVPADGNLHSFFLASVLVVSSAQTGGVIQISFNPDGGATRNLFLYAGGLGAATYYNNDEGIVPVLVAAPGTTITVSQQSAQTLGASKFYADLYVA